MTSDPRAFLALDLGAATSSAALIGRLAHRWRLLGTLALPAGIDADALIHEVVRRAAAADPDLARLIALPDGGTRNGGYGTGTSQGAAVDLPRLVARSVPSQTILVCAATIRGRTPYLEAARATGWRTRGAVLDGTDPLELMRSLLDPRWRSCSSVPATRPDPTSGGSWTSSPRSSRAPSPVDRSSR